MNLICLCLHYSVTPPVSMSCAMPRAGCLPGPIRHVQLAWPRPAPARPPRPARAPQRKRTPRSRKKIQYRPDVERRYNSPSPQINNACGPTSSASASSLASVAFYLGLGFVQSARSASCSALVTIGAELNRFIQATEG